MKKLMVTITAVAMGISAHAAAVDWYVDVYDAGFSGAELGEFTTYILNGNTAATLAASK